MDVAQHFRRIADRLASLQLLTAALAAARSSEAVANVIIDQALPALQAEVGLLAIASEDERSLRNVAFKGVPVETQEEWKEYSVDSPVPVAESARTRKTIIVSTIEERNARYPVLAAVHGVENGGAVTTFPLMARERLLGVLGFCFPTSRAFTEEDLTYLQALADQCALAVERARLAEQAERELEERRRSEARLAESDRRKDEFLAMLAHELRNPLAPIRNAAEVLSLVETSDPRVMKAAQVIERQSGHLSRIVDDLLDVSRVTRGRLTLQRERFDLTELVRITANDHRATLESHALAFAVDVPEHPVWMTGDSTRIAQVITNLLHNSQKFTPSGGQVALSLSVQSASPRAVICVSDTGIGMDAEIAAVAFELFAQADRTLDRSRGGLGLGLSLVRKLVELHGGTVRADSPGQGMGSHFTIELPVEEAAQPAPDRSNMETTSKRRVLVIEDNEDAAEVLQMMLELNGHEVLVAHSGTEGLELAAKSLPDIVLSDIGLPGEMTGYAVARHLCNSGRAKPFLVALTGYGQKEDKDQAHAAGFDAHLTKPVDARTLERLLSSTPLPVTSVPRSE